MIGLSTTANSFAGVSLLSAEFIATAYSYENNVSEYKVAAMWVGSLPVYAALMVTADALPDSMWRWGTMLVVLEDNNVITTEGAAMLENLDVSEQELVMDSIESGMSDREIAQLLESLVE